MLPLVSVITPTWQRNDLLLSRCIPSVQVQDYPNVEHIVVSDGPDPVLKYAFESHAEKFPRVKYFELPERHDGRWGGRPRRYGLERAQGTLIGYNDDDDALRPDHVSKLVATLEAEPGAGFARSLMESHPNGVIGHGEIRPGNVGTPMVLHKRELLDIANWGAADAYEDWNLFNAWLNAGVRYAMLDEVTVDVWPSMHYSLRRF